MASSEQIKQINLLLEKAKSSSGGTEAERDSALKMANKLREKYGLTKDEILNDFHQQPPTNARIKHYISLDTSLLNDKVFFDFVKTLDKHTAVWYDFSVHRIYSYDKSALAHVYADLSSLYKKPKPPSNSPNNSPNNSANKPSILFDVAVIFLIISIAIFIGS